MKKILTTAILSALTCSAFAQTPRTEQAYNDDADYAPGTDSAYSRDADDLRVEPCPDKFDTDWRLTNQDHPCLKTKEELIAERNARLEAEAEVDVDADPIEVEVTENEIAEPRMSTTVVSNENQCDVIDLSDQAVDELNYTAVLNDRENGDKIYIDTDFDPSAEVALSVDQLRDSDIEVVHVEATFEALDDNNSNGIDKVESLDVRGLADEFDEIDYNEDGVIAENEFKLFFTGDLDTDEALCVDGERVTQITDLERIRS